ncbi:4379_t:CDS:2, partial [Acaulospora colombiana]
DESTNHLSKEKRMSTKSRHIMYMILENDGKGTAGFRRTSWTPDFFWKQKWVAPRSAFTFIADSNHAWTQLAPLLTKQEKLAWFSRILPPRKRVREESSSETSEYGDDSTTVEEDGLDSDALDDETPPPASQTAKRRKSSGSKGKPKARDIKPSKAKKSSPTKTSSPSAKKSSTHYG